MSKYGLQLRVKPTQQKKAPPKPALPTPRGFQDDDEDDVEREISRHASKKKALKDIEEQHKKALEEDPSVFDYDGVYDEMKEKAARPVMNDRQERKPKYIQALIEKAKVREREQGIIYERKLAKERSKEDHLYEGKDKFVTSAYKKKLAEEAKWLEEERIRQLREEKEDVTKGDISDFYFNLSKNVAFGAKENELRKPKKMQEEENTTSGKSPPPSTSKHSDSSNVQEERHLRGETSSSPPPKERSESVDPKPVSDSSTQEKGASEIRSSNNHKRNEDAVAAAKERFLARKRAKVVE
ncbi:hypothetical protein LguiA_019563 [Lonicera macranthoides]